MDRTIHFLKQQLNRSFGALVTSWFPDGRIIGGAEYQIINPSRKDRTIGSLSINLNKCFGYDFSTRAFYDVIGLYALRHSLSNSEAVLELLKTYSIDIRDTSETNSHRKPQEIEPPNVAPKPFLKHAMRHRHLGKPVLTFEYRNANDDLIGYTARFEKCEQGKVAKHILAMSWAMRNGCPCWGWNEAGWNGTKPIYGAEKLLKHRGKSVLILEGEKTCDAAQRMFPNFVCLSWRGGVGNIRRVDWRVLDGRVVAIWPDNGVTLTEI